jgi:hypothetical protein
MITKVTIEKQGRIDWRTGEPTIRRTEYTQIEGTVTAADEVPHARPHQLIYTVDAGEATVTIQAIGDLAHTADGTLRGLPEVGDQVRILATPSKTADYLTGGFEHLVVL